MTIDGFGQVELNNVAFRRDGRIEAQCALDTSAFDSQTPCENGMILRVMKPEHKITFCDAAASYQLYALNYSSEHMYDERKPGLKNFYLGSSEMREDFYPRVGYLAAGDLFTTNCIDLNTYASVGAVETALGNGAVYAAAGTQGAIVLAAAAPTVGPVMQVVKKTTMPDGQDAFQIQVLSV
jgi:hypothetical protein